MHVVSGQTTPLCTSPKHTKHITCGCNAYVLIDVTLTKRFAESRPAHMFYQRGDTCALLSLHCYVMIVIDSSDLLMTLQHVRRLCEM